MKSPVELNSLLSKFFYYITWLCNTRRLLQVRPLRQMQFKNYKLIIIIEKIIWISECLLVATSNRNARTICKICSKLTITTLTPFCFFCCYFWLDSTQCSTVSIFDFEQVNFDWATWFIVVRDQLNSAKGNDFNSARYVLLIPHS